MVARLLSPRRAWHLSLLLLLLLLASLGLLSTLPGCFVAAARHFCQRQRLPPSLSALPDPEPGDLQVKHDPRGPDWYGLWRQQLAQWNSSPERVLTAGLLGLTIGLVANLWGQTELLFYLFPPAAQVAQRLHLDGLYPVDGLLAYYDEEYQVHFPKNWLFDQRVAFAKFQGSSPEFSMRNKAGQRALVPDSAWGPAGGGQVPKEDRENLSVVKQLLPPKAPGEPQELNEILGDPQASLQRLLSESLAPAGSKRQAEPLRAARLVKSQGSGAGSNVYYEYEWRTTFDAGYAMRSFSSVALGLPDAMARRYLYTLTAVLPDHVVEEGNGLAELMPKVLAGFIVEGR